MHGHKTKTKDTLVVVVAVFLHVKKRQRHGGRRFCRLEVAETDTDLTLVYITRGGSGYMFLCFLPAVADWSDGCKGANVGGF